MMSDRGRALCPHCDGEAVYCRSVLMEVVKQPLTAIFCSQHVPEENRPVGCPVCAGAQAVAADRATIDILMEQREALARERDQLAQAARAASGIAQETMEEIEYWHQGYLDDTDAPSNGWRRVYDKLKALRREPL